VRIHTAPLQDFWIRTLDEAYEINYEELRYIAPKDCPPGFLDLAIKCCHYEPLMRPDFAIITKEMRELTATSKNKPEEKLLESLNGKWREEEGKEKKKKNLVFCCFVLWGKRFSQVLFFFDLSQKLIRHSLEKNWQSKTDLTFKPFRQRNCNFHRAKK
jgi:hypothetical protein